MVGRQVLIASKWLPAWGDRVAGPWFRQPKRGTSMNCQSHRRSRFSVSTDKRRPPLRQVHVGHRNAACKPCHDEDGRCPWPARSSRRIHPESHVTSSCVGTVEIGRHALKKLFVANLARCFSTTIYDDNLLHSACRHNVIGEGNMQIRLAQNEPCLRIGQKICERLGVGLGVQQHRYQPARTAPKKAAG